MKKLILGAILLFSISIITSCSDDSSSNGSTSTGNNSCGVGRIWVDAYYRADGTYVNGYCRTADNK